MSALGLVVLLAAPPAPGPLDAEKLKAIAEAVERLRSQQRVPGIGAAVAVEGELIWAQGFGLADVENGVPATNDTRFRLASIAKPITAVAALQLVEQAKLDLDADLRRYLPGFPKKPWPITTRQLLAHQGGIRHYQGDEFASVRRHVSVLEGLDVFKDDPLVHEPGTRFLYSTHGYSLAGAVVEAVAGRPFLQQLRQAVFAPAGMASARDDDAREPIPGRARGYFVGPGGRLRNAEASDTSYKVPGGGLVATASDVARFGGAFLQGRLVRADTVTSMLTPQRTRRGTAHGYGLGFRVREGRPREAHHTGGQQGSSTVVLLCPESGVVVVLLTNLEEAPERIETARRIAEIVER